MYKLNIIKLMTIVIVATTGVFLCSGIAFGKRLGEYPTEVDPTSCFVLDKYAYIAEREMGLEIVDVSNPARPKFRGRCDTDYANEVVVEQRQFRGSVRWIPGDPDVDSSSVESGYGKLLRYAYVADGPGGFKVIDVTDPTNPFLAGSCPLQSDEDTWASDLAISGNYAYVTDSNSLFGSFYIIRIFREDYPYDLEPTVIARYAGTPISPENPAYPKDIFISGNYAYIASSHHGLDIFDISDPRNPTHVGNYDNDRWWDNNWNRISVCVKENYAFIGCVAYPEKIAIHSEIQVIDISNPRRPFQNPGVAALLQDPDGFPVNFFLSGDYLYIADYHGNRFGEDAKNFHGTIYIVDVTDPLDDKFVARIGTKGLAKNVFVVRDRLERMYVCEGMSLDDCPDGPIIGPINPTFRGISIYGSPPRLVPEFPSGYQGCSSPAIADIDPDYEGLEIVVGSIDDHGGTVYAFYMDGTPVEGWPKSTSYEWYGGVVSSPSIADLDGDGTLEIVVGSQDGKVYAWHSDTDQGYTENLHFLYGGFFGTWIDAKNIATVKGWPVVATGNPIESSPAIADLDGNSSNGLEVVVGSVDGKVYAWHKDGSEVEGWPKDTKGWIDSSPAIADLDGDGSLEVVVGSSDGKVYAWHKDGSEVKGWPKDTKNWIYSSPAIADLDGDSSNGLEVVVGSHYFRELDYGGGKVYAWHGKDGFGHEDDCGNTGAVEGWPKTIEVHWQQATCYSSPAIADLDGDGKLEVIVAFDLSSGSGLVCTYSHDGKLLNYWRTARVDTEYWRLWPSPAVADLDRDGSLEVVISSIGSYGGVGEDGYNSYYGSVYAWHSDTTKGTIDDLGNKGTVEGWPKKTGGVVECSPAIADLDGDGSLEVVVASNDRKIYSWTCPYYFDWAKANERMPWPKFRHDTHNTGWYGYEDTTSDGPVFFASDPPPDYTSAPPANSAIFMIDDYNDGNPTVNSLNKVTKSGQSSSGRITIGEERLYQSVDGDNKVNKIVYDCSNSADWAFYQSDLWDGNAYLNIEEKEYLSFRVKGASGGEDFYIGFQHSAPLPNGWEPEIKKKLSNFGVMVTKEWQEINIPLTAFSGMDKRKMRALVIKFDNALSPRKGTIYIDNLQFTKYGYGQAKPQSSGSVKINKTDGKLYINGQPFVIKGVGYQPTPIGSGPPQPDNPAIYERDFPLLVKMGCNTIRTWNIRDRVYSNLMAKAADSNIKVVAGFWIDPVNYTNPLERDKIIQQFRDFVNDYKDFPALLMWGLGNENNFKFIEIANKYGKTYEEISIAFYELCNDLAIEAHSIEGSSYHPVMIVNGHLNNIGVLQYGGDDIRLNCIDVWGINAYHVDYNNINFKIDFQNFSGDFFAYYNARSSKPLLMTEYGADAFHTTNPGPPVLGYEDETEQANQVKDNINDIMNASDVCLGGCVMAYSDEWWKDPAGAGPSDHDKGPAVSRPNELKDGYSNEEFWGIVAVERDGNAWLAYPWNKAGDSLDEIRPRKVYDVLKEAFTGTAVSLADFNKDGSVNFIDYSIFASAFGSNKGDSKYIPAADFFNNGIYFDDLKKFTESWKPEPPKIKLLALSDSEVKVNVELSEYANGLILERNVEEKGFIQIADLSKEELSENDNIFVDYGLPADSQCEYQSKQYVRGLLTGFVYSDYSNGETVFTDKSENQPPEITPEIEGQSILLQSRYGFKPINLNEHVYDPDTPLSDIEWTAKTVDGGFISNLIVDIDDDNVATIKPMISDWTGSETIKFTASDIYDEDSKASSITTFTIYKSNRTIEELKSKLLNAQTGYGQSGYGVPTALLEPGVYKFTSNLLISRDTVSEAARNSGIIKIIGKDPNPDNTIFELGDYCIDIMEPSGYLGFYQYIPPRFTLTKVIFENITIKSCKKCPSTTKVFIQTGYGQSGYGEGYWKTIEYPYGKAPIHNYASSLILRNCKVIENIGQKASAIYTNRGILTLENTLIAGNRYPTGSGSAISGLTITGADGRTLFSSTVLNRLDGAIYVDKDAVLVVINSTITYNNNQAAYSNSLYGAIAKDANAKVTIQNSVLWANGSGGQEISSQKKPIPRVVITNSDIGYTWYELHELLDDGAIIEDVIDSTPSFDGYNVSEEWQYDMGARF